MKRDLSDYTPEDIDAMTDAELDVFLDLYLPGVFETAAPGPVSLSNEARYLDLANTVHADYFLSQTDEQAEDDLDLSVSTPAADSSDEALLAQWPES